MTLAIAGGNSESRLPARPRERANAGVVWHHINNLSSFMAGANRFIGYHCHK